MLCLGIKAQEEHLSPINLFVKRLPMPSSYKGVILRVRVVTPCVTISHPAFAYINPVFRNVLDVYALFIFDGE